MFIDAFPLLRHQLSVPGDANEEPCHIDEAPTGFFICHGAHGLHHVHLSWLHPPELLHHSHLLHHNRLGCIGFNTCSQPEKILMKNGGTRGFLTVLVYN